MAWTGVVGAAAGILAAMFLASGSAKVRAPFDAAMAMVRFGVTRHVRPTAGRALGVVELAAAISLILFPSPFLPALAVFALLCVFTALVARALRAGISFECACFGAGERISWATVGRNAVLAALAVLVAAAARPGLAGPSADERFTGLLIGALAACGYLLLSALTALQPFATRLEDADG